MRIQPVTYQSMFLNYTSRTEKISSAPGKKDVVTLSDEAKRMQARNSAQTSSSLNLLDDFMDGAGKDGVITLDEIRAFGEKYARNAERILATTLTQLTISSDHNIAIRTDSEGAVRVDSDLSLQDNNRLETALNEHPDFQQALTKASSSQSFIDAAEKYLDFAKAYEQNPKAAVARYGVGKSMSGGYVLHYTMGQASLIYEKHAF